MDGPKGVTFFYSRVSAAFCSKDRILTWRAGAEGRGGGEVHRRQTRVCNDATAVHAGMRNRTVQPFLSMHTLYSSRRTVHPQKTILLPAWTLK